MLKESVLVFAQAWGWVTSTLSVYDKPDPGLSGPTGRSSVPREMPRSAVRPGLIGKVGIVVD